MPLQGTTGAGGAQRSLPSGGAAYGIPRNARNPALLTSPRIDPASVITTSGNLPVRCRRCGILCHACQFFAEPDGSNSRELLIREDSDETAAHTKRFAHSKGQSVTGSTTGSQLTVSGGRAISAPEVARFRLGVVLFENRRRRRGLPSCERRAWPLDSTYVCGFRTLCLGMRPGSLLRQATSAL